VAKDKDKGSVIASARTVKVRRTAADVVTNHSKTGNHAWTKSVLQSAIQVHGNHGHHALQHVVMTEPDQERDHAIQAAIQIVLMKPQKKLLHVNQRIAHHAHHHHVTAVFQNVTNQTVAKKNVHRHHVTVAFQSATKKKDAKKSASQKNQNVNGQTGRHSVHAVHLATKELNAVPEIATADPISMNQKLICRDQDAKETLSKKNLAITDHVKNAETLSKKNLAITDHAKNANQVTGHHGPNVIAKLNHQSKLVSVIAIVDLKSVTMNAPIRSKHAPLTSVHFQHQRNARDHGMNGAHAMPFVALELDHVIANVFAALLVVQVVTKTCPKRKNAKVMTI